MVNRPPLAFLDQLRAIVGPAHVLTAEFDTAPYLTDWRDRYRGEALAVLRPATTSEVVAVVRTCRAGGVAVVPQGGNTGMCGGSVPCGETPQVVVATARLTRVREVDPDNATITVEAGVTLARVQEIAAQAGLLFPLSLGSEGSCTIGGNVATNAGGTAVLRYGNTRDQVLGLEVVLPDGTVWDGLRGLRKDNTGYDLKQLFIGAEGTLGLITAVVLKLRPRPRVSVTSLAAIPGVAAGVQLLRVLRSALGDRITALELISEVCFRLVERHVPGNRHPLPGHAWYVLFDIDDSIADAGLVARVEEALAAAVEEGIVTDAVVAASQAQAQALWAIRDNISEAQKRAGHNIKHDISVPVGAIARFVEECNAALAREFPGIGMVTFGHLGDGNLHYNVAAPVGIDDRAFLSRGPEVNRVVHDHVARFGGSISAEHGIGQLKRGEMLHYKSPVELTLMRALKSAIDPDGLFNPGKVI